MSENQCLVWLRHDLRLKDNPALFMAAKDFSQVLPVYVFQPGEFPDQSAQLWWLHHSLLRLAEDLGRRGGRLVLRQGEACEELAHLCDTLRPDAVYWNTVFEPEELEKDQDMFSLLEKKNIGHRIFNSSLLREPWNARKENSTPYRVFTPFYKKLYLGQNFSTPLGVPKNFNSPKRLKAGVSQNLEDLNLLSGLPYEKEFGQYWTPGARGAQDALKSFLKEKINSYSGDRDFPAKPGTSRLSPHLHFGEISAREIWHSLTSGKAAETREEIREPFLRQLAWREFAHSILYENPSTPSEPLNRKFSRFPWESNADLFEAWRRGRTGFPLVDAGMRELWHTGWMHNRVRMVVASFLVKDLFIDWRKGAEWFAYTLLDHDKANNTFGWQWTAGCGADAAPFFRIFNPLLQAKKFDRAGDYIRKWIPELNGLPQKYIFEPHRAPDHIFKEAGIVPGETYPLPIVDHAECRDRALAAYKSLGH